jgi:hypothetical protein
LKLAILASSSLFCITLPFKVLKSLAIALSAELAFG